MALLPQTIYAVVRSIPRGRVVTYGDIAGLAGAPTGHRQVARAMRHCPERLPWQRVVGKKDARRARVNIEDPDHAALQRGLLEAEGVVFDDRGCISLQRFGWLWEAEEKAKRPPSKQTKRPLAKQAKRPLAKQAQRPLAKQAKRLAKQAKRPLAKQAKRLAPKKKPRRSARS